MLGWMRRWGVSRSLSEQSVTADRNSLAVGGNISNSPVTIGVPADRDVCLENVAVSFDPNGQEELYIDCRISNPGSCPTIIKNWVLSIFSGAEEIRRIQPRHVSTGIMRGNPYFRGPPLAEDLSIEPLEAGGARQCRLTFTIHGVVAKEDFGSEGTSFKLTAEDVRNRIIEAIHTLSK